MNESVFLELASLILNECPHLDSDCFIKYLSINEINLINL